MRICFRVRSSVEVTLRCVWSCTIRIDLKSRPNQRRISNCHRQRTGLPTTTVRHGVTQRGRRQRNHRDGNHETRAPTCNSDTTESTTITFERQRLHAKYARSSHRAPRLMVAWDGSIALHRAHSHFSVAPSDLLNTLRPSSSLLHFHSPRHESSHRANCVE